MRLRIIVLSIILAAGTLGVSGQKIPSQKPKLVVGITVSGMRYDYLSVYWDKFGDDGIKKMASTGANCKNARYNYLITEPSVGYATIATGAKPSAHGIVSDYWYERLSNQIIYSLDDSEQTTIEGTFGTGPYSPSALHSRTISDELRVISRFKSKSIGISMDPQAAVLMAGHTATGAYWIDPTTASWITSSYYMDSLPEWVREFNGKNYQDIYLDRIWEPLLPIAEYSESMLDNNPFETGFNGQITFPYELSRISAKDRTERDYSVLMSTPWGNTYTKDLAIAAIVNEELGQRGVSDMIHIGFNTTKYLADKYSTWSLEMQDAYLRLDQDIAHLLGFLDDQLGLENVVVYVTAENALADDPRYLEESRIPSGFFNYRTSISLLKSYLNAIYGQGDWVSFYYAQQIYLNHQLIEDSRLSLEDVQDRVARFMIQMGGVSNALQAYVLQRSNFTSGVYERIQNSYYQKRSGDVIIYLTPGWVEHSNVGRNGYAEFKSGPHVPLIFYGWKVNRVTIPEVVSPADIAATIAYFLEISMPENASGKVISDLVK
jgi:arylsulfatase A-like enzyme